MAVVHGTVSLAATTSMTVTRMTTPPLVDQIAALAGLDPAMLGATGYMDDVFTTRLAGDSE